MFYSYCILFFIFSFLGWVMEVTLTLITDKKFVNRGFTWTLLSNIWMRMSFTKFIITKLCE